MNRKIGAILILSFILLTMLYGNDADAQSIFPSQSRLEIKITPRIEKQIIFDGLKYSYTIANSKNSLQTVDLIHIEHKGLREDFKALPNWNAWYSSNGSFATAPRIYQNDDSLRYPPLNSIDPGESVDDVLIFEDQGPPVITEWWIVGWAPTPILDEGRGVILSNGVEYDADAWADTIMDHPDSMPNGNPRNNRLTVFTVGPSKPPTDQAVICDTFILDLIGQVREAASLGWIKHDLRKDRDDEGENDDDDMDAADKNLPGVAKSIIKKLTKVRRECLRGKFGSAREKLRALIKQVNAQRGKHLTEEAYALIKFNAEFLLEKI